MKLEVECIPFERAELLDFYFSYMGSVKVEGNHSGWSFIEKYLFNKMKRMY